MVIQHNMPAMNANRMIGVNNRRTASDLEKLASGFRVNRAADDAAGLAISEKMRGQIRGLSMAEMNVQHGIAMIQTAEGGTQEIHSLLQRMRELSVQSSNGTYQSEDREQLDKEYQALKEEITRIAESTHFNGIHLLAGKGAGIALPDGSWLTAYPGSKMQVFDALTDGITSTQANGHPANLSAMFLSGSAASAALGFQTPYVTPNTSLEITYPGHNGLFTVADTTQLIFERDVSGVWTVRATNDYSNAGTKTLSADGTYTFAHNDGAPGLSLVLTNGFVSQLNAAMNPDVISGQVVIEVRTLTARTLGFNNYTALMPGVENYVARISTTAVLHGTVPNDRETLDFSYQNGSWSVNSAGDSGFNVIGYDGQLVTLSRGADVIVVDISKLLGDPNDDRIISGRFGIEVDLNSNAVTVIDDTNIIYAEAWMLDEEDGGKGESDSVILQIGANGTADQRLAVNRFNLRATNLGDANARLSDSDIATRENANGAIDIIDKAINYVSSVRAYFGATQNRLEHTLNNLGVTKENLTAAESAIRDVNMAKEMMEFTKSNILVQAAQSMLAQANQFPQGVLNLLR